jgi:hypothetical protein
MSVVVVNPATLPVPVTGSVVVTSFSTPEKVTDVNAGTELQLIPTSVGSTANHEFTCAFSVQVVMTAGAVRVNYPLTVPLDLGVTYLASVVSFSLAYVSGTLPSGLLAAQVTTVTTTPNLAGSAYGFVAYNQVTSYNGPIMVLPIPSTTGTSTYPANGLNTPFELVSAASAPYPALQCVYSTTANCTMALLLVVELHPVT